MQQAVLEKIKRSNPRLIYVSGKTCTGKTTFANYLEQHSYKKVELDKIVMDSVVVPFKVASGDGFRTAYRGLGPKEHVAAFVAAARQEILQNLKKSSLVIEGAVALPEILSEIFSGELKDFVFVYFHPVHADTYGSRILSRFMAGAKDGTTGLPKDFWSYMQDSYLEDFKNTGKVNEGIQEAIKKYVARSIEESGTRLESFKASFPEVVVVEV